MAIRLADLAVSLERAGHDPELVAQFLMRCNFTLFAEDVGLLPEGIFTSAIEERRLKRPHQFPAGVAVAQGGLLTQKHDSESPLLRRPMHPR